MAEYFFAPAAAVLAGGEAAEGGCALGAALSLGLSAAAEKTHGDSVKIKNSPWGEAAVDIGDTEAREGETGLAAALRAVCRSFIESGNVFGGLEAEITSEIPAGCGLEEGAALEALLAKTIGGLYFENSVPPQSIALMGTEGRISEKLVSAAGGLVFADFSKAGFPEFYNFEEFSFAGRRLAVLGAGKARPNSEKTEKHLAYVAKMLGHERLAEADEAEFLCQFPVLRERCGDPAAFAALAFFEEDRAAAELSLALERGEAETFFEVMNSAAEAVESFFAQSGLEAGPGFAAAAAARKFLGKNGGAKAAPNGSFALAFVPEDAAESFAAAMEAAGKTCIFADIA